MGSDPFGDNPIAESLLHVRNDSAEESSSEAGEEEGVEETEGNEQREEEADRTRADEDEQETGEADPERCKIRTAGSLTPIFW